MHVKVFEAPNMTTGLSMVRKELGPDALIISTRTVKNGKLGVLGKSILEITAATDTKPSLQTKDDVFAATPSHKPLSFNHHELPRTASPTFAAKAYGGNTTELPHSPPPHQDDRVDLPTHSHDKCQLPDEFMKELDELKKLVHNLAGEMDRYGKKIEASSDTSVISTFENNVALHNLFQNVNNTEDPIITHLLSYGINPKNSTALAGEIRNIIGEDHDVAQETIEETARKVMMDLIKPASQSLTHSDRQMRIAFVGPTGVGKTTTLAKIAAQYITSVSDSIALITIDTYRIAAVEQLKVYGELMNLSVDVVINPRQLDQALFRHRDKDLILIDTAGRSPRDSLALDELATFFLPDFKIENHLVLSATTRENELAEICDQFNKLDISNLILTKIDECSELGVILNHHLESRIPLSFITNGQRVPEDLIEADQQKIAELIIPSSEGSLHD